MVVRACKRGARLRELWGRVVAREVQPFMGAAVLKPSDHGGETCQRTQPIDQRHSGHPQGPYRRKSHWSCHVERVEALGRGRRETAGLSTIRFRARVRVTLNGRERVRGVPYGHVTARWRKKRRSNVRAISACNDHRWGCNGHRWGCNGHRWGCSGDAAKM